MTLAETRRLLKKDLFGEVWRIGVEEDVVILRDTRTARWWLAFFARRLLRREANALALLAGLRHIPELLSHDSATLTRRYLPGTTLNGDGKRSAHFFRDAMRLLRRIHRNGVAHNDLAKEPNVLVLKNGDPALIDFQLASCSAHRGWFFRQAAREDIRHLLKHKRTYTPDMLTKREVNILNSPSSISRLSMAVFKPLYRFITRRVFGWSDREGAGDRGSNY